MIPTPGATGSYHLIVISVLVGIFNFSNEISGAYALLTHATTYILFIFFKDKKETLQEFHQRRQEEKSARLFFLPFEQEFYKKYDMDVDYVGHPLLDHIASSKKPVNSKADMHIRTTKD